MKMISTLVMMTGLLLAGAAQALTLTPYDANAFAKAKAENRATAVVFYASWCPTCRRQDAALQTLKTAPDLDVTVFVADYDKEHDLKKV
jgi:thioredoxin 1